MEYQLVQSDSFDFFQEAVNTQLAEGWNLAGGVAISTVFESYENSRKGYMENSTTTIYVQAMTRTKL